MSMLRHLDKTTTGLLTLLLAVVLLFSVLIPDLFLQGSTFTSIAFQLPELGLLTLAMFIAILGGGMNLCIITTANLSGLFMAWVLINQIPANAGIALQLFWLIVALLGASLIAVIIGGITGMLISRVGAHPILVTLGTMTTLKGIGIGLTQGAALSGMPEVVRYIGSGTLLGVPVLLLIFLLSAFWLQRLLEKNRLGHYITMSGSNINATYFSGVNTHRVQIAIYVISSLLCVLAGLCMMARFNSARMGYGDAYLLLTVLAIILGGTSPFGGFGRVQAVMLALLILQILATGLNLLNVTPHFSLAMWGLTLLLVLSLRYLQQRYQHRRTRS